MKKIALIGTALLFPLVSFAALTNVAEIVTDIGGIINTIIPIMFAVALLGFFYGLVLYIFASDHDSDKAKKYMLWGIVALFVMATVWGLVNWLGDALDIDSAAAPAVTPLIPQP